MLIFKAYQRVVNMMKSPLAQKVRVGVVSALMTLGVAHNAYADAPAQKPLFQTNSVKPIMMLNMSKDHQMFFKVYDDYSDITDPNGGDPDGNPDLTYVPKYEYYGYFDGTLCYEYVADNYFNPVAKAVNHYCTAGANQWSGNFLNWATMTRIDAIRKILYGGYRSTDTTTETILERAFIPHDAHAFAKFYDGDDIAKLTPFTVPKATKASATGITICNVTPIDSANPLSQKNTKPPILRVAKGNYSLWASNETNQCQWNAASNANVATSSGIYAYDKAPASGSSDKLTASKSYAPGEYVARVKVCVAGYLNEDECKQYEAAGSVQKPIGLFQEFGETKKIMFGLLTGSYGANRSGGALRKTIGNMDTEIKSLTGEFLINKASTASEKDAAAGAISVLDSLRIFGYSFSSNNYGGTGSDEDKCPIGIVGFANGTCTNWGNPQAEIYMESLRYLTGYRASAPLVANSKFAVNDTGKVPKFTTAAWGAPPVQPDNWCAPLNVLQFNTSSSSFDADSNLTGNTYDQYDNEDSNDMNGITDLGLTSTTLTEWINKIGGVNHEELSGSFFSGFKTGSSVTSDSNGICTGKSFTSLSAFRGSCPDAPRLNGGYSIAGLSYYARQTDLNSEIRGSQHVRTLGVALAPAVPSIKIPVPGTADALGKNPKYIQVLPACKSNRKQTTVYGKSVAGGIKEGNCTIVDFKIVETDIAVVGNTTNKAKLYVNWEVAEQGNDYDQDMWGTIDISVNNTDVGVTTRLMAVSAGADMGFGYVISGTETDGFKVSSGHRNFSEPNTYCETNQCKCNASDAFGPCELTKLVAGVTVPGMAATPEQKYKVNKDATKDTAKFLPTALELAAKWGGYSSNFESEAKNAAAMAQKPFDSEFIAKRIRVRDYKKDSYFYAADPRALAKSLRDAFNEIAAGIGAASSVATVSARVNEGSLVYQAQFNSEDWTGDLLAYEFTKEGNIKAAPKYCTSDIVVKGEKCTGQMAKSATSRHIYTRGASGLLSLDWANLTSTQKLGLRLLSETNDDNAKKRLDWLSGNATYEEASGGTLRNRGIDANRNILGDIVNSSPVYIGDKNFRYENLPNPAGAAYKTFLAEKKAKPKFIMVGANDGMVHAFNASTMAESFAFIPSQLFARDDELLDEGTKLTNMSSPTYGVTTANGHVYSVDGPITYSDVYIDVDDGNGNTIKKWRRVVVGTLGAGGRGIYALDVTDATPRLLFELNADNYSQLGYVIGKPIIAPMKNGSWAVIFGNGSHSETASSLFVIDIENPTSAIHSKVISTGEGTGLSAPALLLNSVGQATIAYAGDINGNMWRFDLSSADPDKWEKDYKVFKATTTADATESQPITGAPTLGVNAKKDFKTMVYFGTGKYFDVLDNSALIPVQSFYAVLDTGAEVSRSSLLSKVVTTTAGTTNPTREVAVANPDWDTQNGWYLDFDVAGERVTTKPLLLFDKLIFPTLIPTTLQCNAGGESWLMEVSAIGDKYANDPILSENIYATSLVLGNLNFVSVEGGGGAIVKNQSDGVVTSVAAPPPQPIEGRESWRQLQ